VEKFAANRGLAVDMRLTTRICSSFSAGRIRKNRRGAGDCPNTNRGVMLEIRRDQSTSCTCSKMVR